MCGFVDLSINLAVSQAEATATQKKFVHGTSARFAVTLYICVTLVLQKLKSVERDVSTSCFSYGAALYTFFLVTFFFAVLYFLGYLNVWSMDGQDYIGGNGQWNKRETENSPC